MSDERKVLLYSGGMDSWLIDKIAKPDTKLFINIGTASAISEMAHLPEDVTIAELKDLGQLERVETDFILPLRNLYLIAMATNYGEHIILGANATDATYDKTYEFAEKLEDLLNYMWLPQKWTSGKHITVDVSYREYTKSQLLKKFLDNGGDWRDAYYHTFSCYTPDNKTECHNCRPCFLKLMAFIDNDIDIPKDILQTYVPYLKNKLKEYEIEWKDRLYTRDDYEKVIRMAER